MKHYQKNKNIPLVSERYTIDTDPSFITTNYNAYT